MECQYDYFLDSQLKTGDSSISNQQLLTDILISFGGQPAMQQFIARKLVSSTPARQLFFLDAMMGMKIKEFPAVWTSGIASILAGRSDARVKSKAIELVQLRSIKPLARILAAVASSNQNPAALRMQAIETMSADNKKLSDADFSFLVEQLKQKREITNAQQAAAILEKSKLSDKELKILADQYLPNADPFILPKLVAAFEGEHSAEIGKALAATLTNSSTLDGYSEERLRKVFEKYPSAIAPDVNKLIAKLNTVHADRIKYLKEIENNLNDGVLDNGRALFFGKATCYNCHKIGTEGGGFGPDLTSIQRDRSTHDLLEAIVYPSASFVREYETYKIKTTGGEQRGIIKSRTPEEIILATSLQSSVRIPTSDIKSTVLSDVSMMPQGLDKLLTKKEMADLMAFLLGQDQDPDTDQKILRHTVNH